MEHVLGTDILLKDISEFTTNMRVSENGKVIALTDDGRIIGLPAGNYENRSAALLKRSEELGIPIATDASQAMTAQKGHNHIPVKFISEGKPWCSKATVSVEVILIKLKL